MGFCNNCDFKCTVPETGRCAKVDSILLQLMERIERGQQRIVSNKSNMGFCGNCNFKCMVAIDGRCAKADNTINKIVDKWSYIKKSHRT